FLFHVPAYVAERYEGWLNLLAHNDPPDWRLDTATRNLSLLFRVWLTPPSETQHPALQLFAAAGAAVVCLAGRWRGWPHKQLLFCVLGLAGCWVTLFGPFVESYTYILIWPALAAVLFEAARGRRPILY